MDKTPNTQEEQEHQRNNFMPRLYLGLEGRVTHRKDTTYSSLELIEDCLCIVSEFVKNVL
jgi:hypothetical protein